MISNSVKYYYVYSQWNEGTFLLSNKLRGYSAVRSPLKYSKYIAL